MCWKKSQSITSKDEFEKGRYKICIKNVGVEDGKSVVGISIC